MTIFELKAIMETKEEHYPISDEYNATHGQKHNVHWSSQKEHLLPWLDAQATNGKGGFTRKKPNYDAKIMYANLSCPECLLWIAEAAGLSKDIILSAAKNAKTNDGAVTRAAIIRHDIPWNCIEAALLA